MPYGSGHCSARPWLKGHGCDTPGKRSPDGSLREFEFNGDVAARAQAILERAGIQAVLTRPATLTVKDVSLSQRVALANKLNARLFVSIHANAAGNGREWHPARGYEVYTLAPGGERTVLAHILLKWARQLLCPFDKDFPIRGLKHANFYVLRYTKMPAVLIEHAFMTNKADCALLKSNEFRQRAAEHIARAVCEHLGVPYPEPKSQPDKKYRLKTGTFNSKEAAEEAANWLRKARGWTVYVVEE